MQSPTASVLSSRSGPPRALVLCVAVMLGFAVWSASKIPSAGAQETKQPPATVAPPAPPAIPTPPTPPQPPKVTEKTTKKIGPIGIVIESDNAASDEEPDDEAKDGKAGRRTITVKKNGKTVKITGVPEDDEIDAIGDAAKMNPSLAAMVVGIVAVVFFAPVIAIALIVWYRMRKARMQNETILKLAERGIVASPETLATLAGGSAAAVAPGASIGDALRETRQRTVSSDLRKGVILAAVGLAITIYTTSSHDGPNVFGLVLLFVGIGYGALWWFEQRPQMGGYRSAGAAPPPPPPAPGPGSGGSPG